MGDTDRGRRGYVPEGIDDAMVTGGAVREAPSGSAPDPAGSMSSGASGEVRLPRLGLRGWARWVWRRLTSMSVALMLLMLLAVAAVPGSVLPQRPQDPARVARYLAEHPGRGAWLDRLGFFDVFASPWFAAVYLLLFVSLVGCILPRTAAHLRAVRARPPRAPRRFERFPVNQRFDVEASPEEVVAAAAAHLRRRGPSLLKRFRVDVHAGGGSVGGGGRVGGGAAPSGVRTVSAERGYLRETGNLVFHLALVGLLVAVAVGQMVHYRAQVLVTEGRGFANAVVDFDTYAHGSWFRPAALRPFTMTLNSFEATFATGAADFAQSRDFVAHVTVREPGDDVVGDANGVGDAGDANGVGDGGRAAVIRVNRPLHVDGVKVYLQGNGFAPQVTVRDAKGEVAFSGRVPFIPQDAVYTSRGVIKVPDVSAGLDQIGLVGYLLPTAEADPAGGLRSAFPQPLDPVLVLNVYHGDLGLDGGVPQNVYRLDTARMQAVPGADGEPAQLVVRPGQTVDLPGDLGRFTFDALPRYVALDLRRDPSVPWILGFALAAVAGLALSLFVPRRRVWVRATPLGGGGAVRAVPSAGAAPAGAGASGAGGCVVEVAGLARGDDGGLAGEVGALVAALPGVRPSDTGT